MEVDDVVMRTGDDDETSTEHLCTPKFADVIPTSRDCNKMIW